jgi:hypothetical protein
MLQQRWRVVVGAVGLACLLRWVGGNSAAVEPARGVPAVLGSSVVGEGSSESEASAADWWSHTDKLRSVADTSHRGDVPERTLVARDGSQLVVVKTGTVPDLALVARDGSPLIVVGTIDARCHPKEREESMVSRPQVAAVDVMSGQEE